MVDGQSKIRSTSWTRCNQKRIEIYLSGKCDNIQREIWHGNPKTPLNSERCFPEDNV